MKKFILMMLLPMLCVGSYAQSKFFAEALQRGRQPGKFYLLENAKSKSLKMASLKAYADTNGYILGNCTTKDISRFGDVAETVATLEFLPKSEYLDFVWESMKLSGEGALSTLQQSGSCLVYTPGEKQPFTLYDHVRWSGPVDNGQLSGEGYGFCYQDGSNTYVHVKGNFAHGIPQGECTFATAIVDKKIPSKVSPESVTVSVGTLSDGMASFKGTNGKYGFVAQDGQGIVWPSYEQVLKEFTNGRAEVLSGGKEIVIDKSGNFIDHTDHQKQLMAEEKAEQERLAAEREQAEIEARIAREKEAVERERLRAEAARRRVEKFRNCKPGDRVFYSQNWEHSDGVIMDWIFGKTSYTMAVICFVEQNVDNGERLQIRVGSVSSSSSSHYTTPEIDGIKYNKGDVLWIKPFENTNWQIE